MTGVQTCALPIFARFEPRTLAAQASGPQRRETTSVRQLRERVRLIHKLRELSGTEKLPQHGGHGTHVDQIPRHRHRKIRNGGHTLLRDALHAKKPDANLILQELSHGPNTSISEMVYVVLAVVCFVVLEVDQFLRNRDNVLDRKQPLLLRNVDPEPSVCLVTADPAEVVPSRVEKDALDILPRVLHTSYSDRKSVV